MDSKTKLLIVPISKGVHLVSSSKQILFKLFPKIINTPYGRSRMTAIVMRSSLLLAITLTFILLINGAVVGDIKMTRILIGIFVVFYFIVGERLIQKKSFITAAWMLLAIYTLISALVLLTWSLNTSIGILSVAFIILLAGILLGPKYIFIVTSSVILVLFTIQIIHLTGFIKPDLSGFSKTPHIFDVIAFSTIIGIFALISWLSGKQTEHSIQRALNAEEKIKQEKINLINKLNEQSIRLRQLQLQEMASLYKFAEIGQSTTATLHELSNQLSILSLDINDIHARHRNSKAIKNAKEGIENINVLVQQTRKRLNDNRDVIIFNCIPIIERTIKELQKKFISKGVTIEKLFLDKSSFQLKGDPSNLSHILTILLKNSFDACITEDHPLIKINIHQKTEEIKVSIIDNGPGISQSEIKKLFLPHKSTKPNGLGIGLYITKHIIETQFGGRVEVKILNSGSKFIISLPRYTKNSK